MNTESFNTGINSIEADEFELKNQYIVSNTSADEFRDPTVIVIITLLIFINLRN